MKTGHVPKFLLGFGFMGAGGIATVPAENICIADHGKNRYLQSAFGPQPKHTGYLRSDFSEVGG
jgi:hypothetical protein